MKCHLEYKFGIKEDDWFRIQVNIDSKCRTAFNKKRKAMKSVSGIPPQPSGRSVESPYNHEPTGPTPMQVIIRN